MNETFNLEEYNKSIISTLDKKELKLIFDMHGEIGLEEHLQDIMRIIKNEIMEIK